MLSPRSNRGSMAPRSKGTTTTMTSIRLTMRSENKTMRNRMRLMVILMMLLSVITVSASYFSDCVSASSDAGVRCALGGNGSAYGCTSNGSECGWHVTTFSCSASYWTCEESQCNATYIIPWQWCYTYSCDETTDCCKCDTSL